MPEAKGSGNNGTTPEATAPSAPASTTAAPNAVRKAFQNPVTITKHQ